MQSLVIFSNLVVKHNFVISGYQKYAYFETFIINFATLYFLSVNFTFDKY